MKKIAFPPKLCPACNKEFYRSAHTAHGWRKQIYCSYKCGASQRLNRINLKCDYCEKEFETTPGNSKNKKRVFCCIKCYGKFRSEKLPTNEQANYKGGRIAVSHYGRIKEAEGRHTDEQWEIVKKRYNYKCAMCKKSKKLTRDHLMPLSKGGSNYISNIQPLCASCNSKKGNKILEAASTCISFDGYVP